MFDEARVKAWTGGVPIEGDAVTQIHNLSKLPVLAGHIAIMPDVHLGKGATVGSVIPTKSAIIPAAVGVDIGCGMVAVQLDMSASDLPDSLSTVRAQIERDVPVGFDLHDDRAMIDEPLSATVGALYDRFDALAIKARLGKLDEARVWRQIGTLGGGNHFIELCIDTDDAVWMFLHSGSRGVGNRIATRHINVAKQLCRDKGVSLPNADLAYLEEDTPEFDTYIVDLRWAQQFALANREEMMDRFRQAFAHWMQVDPEGVERERINTHHNYTERERHADKDVWVTRKGAVNAHRGVMGVIPGSMGTRSYIVRGKGNPTSLCSAPHGAGRRFSRTEAKRRFSADDLADRMRGIEYRHGEQWVDEIPDAYKSIDAVMEDSKELVEVITSLRQVVNVKGT
jgi:tRNA-splicing ligase RtcB